MNKGITAERYHGRWYGMMICLGEESGRDMKKLLSSKASEISTMLEISNEFPEEFKYINKLLDLEKKKEDEGNRASAENRMREQLAGSVDARAVYLRGRDWEKLLVDGELNTEVAEPEKESSELKESDKATESPVVYKEDEKGENSPIAHKEENPAPQRGEAAAAESPQGEELFQTGCEWETQAPSQQGITPTQQNMSIEPPASSSSQQTVNNSSDKKGKKAVWIICGLLGVLVIGLIINAIIRKSNENEYYMNQMAEWERETASAIVNEEDADDTMAADEYSEEAVVEAEEAAETVEDEESLFENFKREIEGENSTLPMEVDYGTTLTKMAVTKYYIIFTYTIDEDLMDLSLMRQNKKKIKKLIKENIQNMSGEDKEAFQYIANTCKKLKINWRCHYQGNKTKKSFDVDLRYTEL